MPQRRLNVLSIVTDQQRYDTLGCNGAPVCRTPNADRLAAQGVRFTSAYTNTAICTAERASLLTGLEPHKHGMIANTERNIGLPWNLPEHLVPFTRCLAEAGYRCGLVGKWHLGRDRGPEELGIEGAHFPGWCPSVDHPEYLAHLEAHGLPRWSVRDVIQGTSPNGRPALPMAGIYEGPVEGTYPHFLAERAIACLRDYAGGFHDRNQPFHLSLHFFGPHLPYMLPREYAEMYDPVLVRRSPTMAETFAGKPAVQREYSAHWAFDTYPWDVWQRVVAMYWGYVTMIDDQVGRVLDALRELDLWDETAVFFTTDHAGFVGNHRLCDKGPAMYDDIYHVPFIGRVPGGARGVACDEFITLLDMPATFLDLGDVAVPEAFDGRSLMPLLRGETVEGWREDVFFQFHGHHFPYPQRGIRTRTHKLVVNAPDVNEFYDLAEDPSELHNRYGHPAYREVEGELVRRLYAHLEAQDDNFRHWMTSFHDV